MIRFINASNSDLEIFFIGDFNIAKDMYKDTYSVSMPKLYLNMWKYTGVPFEKDNFLPLNFEQPV